jgi:hypothetical protein
MDDGIYEIKKRKRGDIEKKKVEIKEKRCEGNKN